MLTHSYEVHTYAKAKHLPYFHNTLDLEFLDLELVDHSAQITASSTKHVKHWCL